MSNARVLAAAPDLLAACEWQQWFEDECRILTEIGREERKREEHGEEPWFHWFSEWKRAFWLRDTARELRQAALVKAKGEPEC